MAKIFDILHRLLKLRIPESLYNNQKDFFLQHLDFLP